MKVYVLMEIFHFTLDMGRGKKTITGVGLDYIYYAPQMYIMQFLLMETHGII